MAKKSKPRAPLPAIARTPRAHVAPLRPPPLVLDSITAYEKALGGRRRLIEVLSAAPSLPPDIQRVFAVIADRDSDARPLAELCQEARISPGELFAAFEHASKAIGEVLAMVEAVKALPAAAADVAMRTVPHETICDECHGLGEIVPRQTKKEPNPSPVRCVACLGKGVIKRDSSLEHQRLLFEYTGVLKKSGVQVNTQVNVNQPTGTLTPGGSLEQLQHTVSEILYGRSDPPPTSTVDAEIVHSPALPRSTPDH